MYQTNKTRIVATLGPSSQRQEDILSLVEAGMDVARINLSHGNRESHAHFIQAITQSRDISGKGTAILLDTRGPEIRVGELGEGRLLQKNQQITLSCTSGSDDSIEVNYDKIADDVSPGDFILLDDGKMRLQVTSCRNTDVIARVIVGGLLHSPQESEPSGRECQSSVNHGTGPGRYHFRGGTGRRLYCRFLRQESRRYLEVRKVIEEAGGNQNIIAKIEIARVLKTCRKYSTPPTA